MWEKKLVVLMLMAKKVVKLVFLGQNVMTQICKKLSKITKKRKDVDERIHKYELAKKLK